MSYLPLIINQNTDITLNGNQISFNGVNSSDYFLIGDNYFNTYYLSENRYTKIEQDGISAKVEGVNSDGQVSNVLISPLDAKIQSFDTSINSNPAAQIITQSNGDVIINCTRLVINGNVVNL